MPTLKPDTSPSYLLPASNPLNIALRNKREREIRENLTAFVRLLLLSAIAGSMLALRK